MVASLTRFFLLSGLLLVFSFSTGCLKRNSGNGPEVIELVDTDNDGTPNIKDDDIDGDGIPNITDNDIDGDGIINTEDPDMDGDTIDNIDDNDIDGDGIINTEDPDMDGDGRNNDTDTDIDGDGIENIDDNDIDGDGIPNSEDPDLDGDGINNDTDTDIDGDGIPNENDIDIDGDGIENGNDDDIDGDGVPNDQDSTQGGTGNEINGTEGTANDGNDKNEGTTNDGNDTENGETDNDDYVSGIVVVAVDTVGYSISLDGAHLNGTVSQSEIIDLNDVRENIRDNDIALSTFTMTDIKIVSPVSNSFIDVNQDTRIIITVSYFDGSEKIPALGSLEQNGVVGSVITIGQLATGLSLNHELFADRGYNSFTDLVKDESKNTVETIIEVTFLDEPTSASSELELDFILKADGKRPM